MDIHRSCHALCYCRGRRNHIWHYYNKGAYSEGTPQEEQREAAETVQLDAARAAAAEIKPPEADPQQAVENEEEEAHKEEGEQLISIDSDYSSSSV